MTIVTNDIDLRTLVINQLSARQYNSITPAEDQIYFVEETRTVEEKINDALNDYTTTNNLSTVALTGDYNDLVNTPSFSNVAYTGNYNDLTNTPYIPDDYVVAVSTPSIVYGTDINGDQTEYNLNSFGAIDDVTLNGNSVVVNKIASLNISSAGLSGDYNDLANTPSLANVATSGDYNDLTNKPTIPPAVVVDQVYNGLSANAQSGVALESIFINKQNILTAGTNINITNNTISTDTSKVTFRTWTNS